MWLYNIKGVFLQSCITKFWLSPSHMCMYIFFCWVCAYDIPGHFMAMQRYPWQNELISNTLSILISRITSAYFTPGSYLHMCIWSDQKLSAILFACTLTVQCTVRLTSPATDTHASHGSHGRGGSFEQISNQKWPMMRCQDTNYNTPQEFENSTSESLLLPTSPL